MKFNQGNKEYSPRTDGVSNTLSTSTKDNMLAMPELRMEDGCLVDKDGKRYRIRKLTPRECFRLMDVKDEDIDKIQQAGIAKTNQYKLAGNSIVVSPMYHIFRKLFVEKENETAPTVSADEFRLMPSTENEADGDRSGARSEVLEIGGPGNKVRGLNYKLSKCCNPIHGDKVFGFISSEGVIKVHRCDCPNAANIRQRYPDRIIETRWSGSFDGQMAATLRILGYDDIGIVTNFTSIISKERNASLRSISIDSHDGLFQGFVVVGISGKEALNSLIKKIKTVKGVKDVTRVDSAG